MESDSSTGMGRQSPSKHVALDRLFIGLLTLASFYFFYLRPGLVIGHDLLYEIVRLIEFKQAVATQIFPRLAPDLYRGYGSPIFVFYPPLFLWITSLVDFAVKNLNNSVKIAVIALGLTGSIFCYSFLRLFSHHRAAFLGSLFYLLAPYKFADIYSRNAFAEYTAFCLLPPVFYFLALHFLAEVKDCAKYQTGLFISLLLLSLSHVISLLIVLPFVAATALHLCWLSRHAHLEQMKTKSPNRSLRPVRKAPQTASPAINRLLRALATILLALGGATFYLLPAFSYRDLVRMEDLLTGKFYFGQNFVSFSDLFLERSSFLYQSPLLLIPLLWALYYVFSTSKKLIGSSLGLLGLSFSLVSLFIMSSPSLFLWNIIPLVAYTQFPWRFLLLFSFFISWTVTFIADQFSPRREGWFYAAITAAILLLGILHYSQHRDFRTFDASAITSERILYQNLRSTVGNEYLPRAADNLEPGISERLKAVKAARTGGSLPNPTRYQQCQFFPQKEPFEFALLNFPYWKVTIDGMPVLNSKTAATLQVEVPPGEHCVKARLGYLNLQVIGFFISACSVALFLTTAAWKRRAPQPPR